MAVAESFTQPHQPAVTRKDKRTQVWGPGEQAGHSWHPEVLKPGQCARLVPTNIHYRQDVIYTNAPLALQSVHVGSCALCSNRSLLPAQPPTQRAKDQQGTEPRRLISELSTSLKEVETSMAWGSAKGRSVHTADATRVLLIQQRSLIIVN